jgi:2-polyprenyl-6-methoxyphenol hydroxylase-like FAD-dependent oxidoreductase
VAKALIIGAGIGGLAAAIALRQVGVEPVVFERSGKMREIGAGITLWANAVKALKRLGVYDAVRAAGVAEIGGEIRSWRGEKIFEIPTDELRVRFGEANLAVHRADLQGALLAALTEGTARLGAECVCFVQDGAGVVVRLADGHEKRGDTLIGADGINSSVWAQLFDRREPRYAGYSGGGGSLPLPGSSRGMWGSTYGAGVQSSAWWASDEGASTGSSPKTCRREQPKARPGARKRSWISTEAGTRWRGWR